jgi:flagellar protein FliO/FliZ
MQSAGRRLAPGLALALLALIASSALAEPPKNGLAPHAAENVPAVPHPADEPAPIIDTNSPEAPPSTYDRTRAVDGTLPEVPESLVGQLFKTVFALAAVCGFIYLLFRWGPARLLLQVKTGRGGKFVRIVERVPVDQRSSLLVIDVSGERLLISSGEGGMRVLTRMDPAGSVVDVPLSQPSKPFRSFIDIVRPKPSSEDDNAPK